jgi:hypothetical protein
MPELEQRLREVRPEWPEPSAAAEARARAALDLPASRPTPSSWRTGARRGPRLLAGAGLLVAAGAAAAAALIGGSGSPPAAEPASLSFGPVQRIGGPVSYFGGEPDVAVDGRGSVTVVWGRAGRIVASTRPPGGGWSAPERLSDPAVRATRPQVAADRAGNLVVVWKERTAGERLVERFRLPSGAPAGELVEVVDQRWSVVARLRPAGGAWGPAERLAPESAAVRDFEQPQLGMALDGTALVAWDAGGAVFARVRPSGGGWREPVRLGAGAIEAVDPRMVVSPSGRAIVVWSARDAAAGGLRTYTVNASTLEAGKWTKPVTLGSPTMNAPFAIGAVNDRGDAVVAWGSARGGPPRTPVHAVVREAGSEWSEPEQVGTTRSDAFGLRALVGMERSGRAVVVPPSGRPEGVSRLPGGAWTPLDLLLNRNVSSGTMISDASGRALLALGSYGPRVTRIQSLDRGLVGFTAVSPGLTLAAGADGTSAVAWIAQSTSGASAVVATVADPEE